MATSTGPDQMQHSATFYLGRYFSLTCQISRSMQMGPILVMYTNAIHDTQDMSRWTVPITACPVYNAIKQLYGQENIT